MELKDIQELLKQVNKLNLAEVTIEKKDLKLTIRTHEPGVPATYTVMPQQTLQPSTPQPIAIQTTAAPQQPASAVEAKAASTVEANLITIKSPMIGTFYRASGPDKPACVNIGDEIKVGSVLCIIEAMKLFNEIESEQTGRIVKILVENAKPVEYDQPLFLVEPI